MPDEGSKAYEWFVRYRGMGTERSIVKAVQQYGAKPSYKTQLERWSKRFAWQERVKAWDAAEAAREERAREQDRQQMLRRHYNQAVVFQNKVVTRLQAMSDADLAKLSPADLVRWFEVAVRIEREARGLPGNTHGLTDGEGKAFVLLVESEL